MGNESDEKPGYVVAEGYGGYKVTDNDVEAFYFKDDRWGFYVEDNKIKLGTPKTIRVNCGFGVQTIPEGNRRACLGRDQSVVIRPDDGYYIINVKVNGLPIDLSLLTFDPSNGFYTYIFKTVDNDKDIKINFKEIPVGFYEKDDPTKIIVKADKGVFSAHSSLFVQSINDSKIKV